MTSRTFSTLQSQPPKPRACSTRVLKYWMTAVMFSVSSPNTGSPCGRAHAQSALAQLACQR